MNRTYAVGRFLAGAARKKSSETQTIHRKCVSPDQFRANQLRHQLTCFLQSVETVVNAPVSQKFLMAAHFHNFPLI